MICECVLFPEEIRPSNSVYRSTFTYYTHRRALNDIDTLSSPSPHHAPEFYLNMRRNKKRTPQLNQKVKGKGNFAFSLFFSFSKELPPRGDAFSISNLICTNDQAKRVCDCVGYLRWKWVGPLRLVGWGVVLDMRVFTG